MPRPYLHPRTFVSLTLFTLLILIPLTLTSCLKKITYMLELELFTPSPSSPALTLILDPMTLIFMSTVTLISLSVYIFSSSYMAAEPFLNRFSTLVFLFILSMFFLISIPNMISLLVGWDGLGLTSFLLILYYQNPKSFGAGMLTFMTNRLGDALIVLAITLTVSMGHWNLPLLFHSPSTTLLPLLLMTAAITKSAQIPFSSWLPAAMAAPTPVSALVHSSTLVTAGVYILIRFYPMMNTSLITMKLLLILSVLTTLMAGMAAMYETDMKKIIALSTLSQLGLMMTSISLHAPSFTFFHLITHAMFKALLFICAGTLIHAHYNTQDLRLMGNIAPSMWLTSGCMNLANMSLCGLPFMAGFYSKDMIIEMTMSQTSTLWIFLLTGLSTALTAAYSFRFSYYTLWSPSSFTPLIHLTDNTQPNYSKPMITLSIGAVTAGSLLNWTFMLPYSPDPLPLPLKLAALMFTLLGLLLAQPTNLQYLMSPSRFKTGFTNVLSTMWFLIPLSTQSFSRPVSKLSFTTLKVIDHGWNELIGSQGLKHFLWKLSALSNYTAIISINSMLLIFASASFIIIFMV